MIASISPYLVPNNPNYSTGSTSRQHKPSYIFVYCSTFSTSVPFSNALIFCWFFIGIKDIGSSSTKTYHLQLNSDVYSEQSWTSKMEFFSGNSQQGSVLNYSQKSRSYVFDWVLNTPLKFSVSYCLLKPNYWSFISNIS